MHLQLARRTAYGIQSGERRADKTNLWANYNNYSIWKIVKSSPSCRSSGPTATIILVRSMVVLADESVEPSLVSGILKGFRLEEGQLWPFPQGKNVFLKSVRTLNSASLYVPYSDAELRVSSFSTCYSLYELHEIPDWYWVPLIGFRPASKQLPQQLFHAK